MKRFPALIFFLVAPVAMAQTQLALTAPPQGQGLPYTRSAEKTALDKIKDGIAVYPGSRYGYLRGYRVRLSETDLLHAEAVEADGAVYVPGAFAALVGAANIRPKPAQPDLAAIAGRWVYSPEEMLGNPPASKMEFNAAPGVATLSVNGKPTTHSLTWRKARGCQSRACRTELFISG